MNSIKKKNILLGGAAIIVVTLIIVAGLIYKGKIIIHNKENDKYEESDLTAFIDDVTEPLGWLVVLHTFSQNADRVGTDYLSLNEDKEVFVLEYILQNKDNDKNFVVLNAVDGEKIDASPRDDMTNAYYPYNLFNKEYKKFFNENFDVNKRIISTGGDSEYDKSKEYIYYPNRHMGANGLYVKKMEVVNTKYDETSNKYTASIKMTYSDRLKEDTNKESEDATLVYTINNGNIIMESFIVK